MSLPRRMQKITDGLAIIAFPAAFIAVVALLVHMLVLPFAHASGPEGDRTTTIDFEEELIEGMNKRPLDSLTQLSDRRDQGDATHLYWKKRSFPHEIRETALELPLAQ